MSVNNTNNYTKHNVKLPHYIISRIEELNIQNEDYSLTSDERQELQLLESIPYSIKLKNIMLEKRDELDYELKNSNPPLADKIFKIASDFRYIDKLLESARN